MSSESDSDSSAPLASHTRSRQDAARRRRNTDLGLEESNDPTYTPRNKAVSKARHTMPASTRNAISSSPSTSKTPSQKTPLARMVTPKSTPTSKVATVMQRLNTVLGNATALLDFYASVASDIERSGTEEGFDFDEDIQSDMQRYWNVFETSKAFQVYAKKNVSSQFLNAEEVLTGNEVDEDSKESKKVLSIVQAVNHATFAHLVAQLPFRLSSRAPKWTVADFAKFVSTDQVKEWPFQDIEELEDAREGFFSYIFVKRKKVVVTGDDLYLFFDICTQIVIHYLWSFVRDAKNDTVKNRKTFANLKFADYFTYEIVLDSLHSHVDLKDKSERKALKDVKMYCEKISKERLKKFEDMKYSPSALQKEYPYKTMVVAIVGYLESVRQRGDIPLMTPDELGGMSIPKHLDGIFSPSLRELVEEDSESEGPHSKGEHSDDDESSAVSAVSELRRSSRSNRTTLQFDKDNRLRRVQRNSEDQVDDLVKGKGVEGIRDQRFDEDDPDVMMEEDIAREKEKKKAAKRGASTAKRGKGKGKAESSRKTSKRSRGQVDNAEDEDDEEEEEEEEEEASIPSKGKGKAVSHRSASRQERLDSDADYEEEMSEEALEKERKASEARRQNLKGKRKQKDAEEASEGDEERAGPSNKKAKVLQKETEEERKERLRLKKESLMFRYATGGNKTGRKLWTLDETNCLLEDLEALYPQYEEGMALVGRFFIWKEILQRHGPDGTVSTILANRNNVQLKDKTRNIVERMLKKDEEIPEHLQPYI